MLESAAMNDRNPEGGGRGAEILIVDDELSVRKGYRALFEAEGYRVCVARNGEEAVALVADRRPDLVLMDVMMPKMNGIVACRRIRESDAVTPILFFTALPSEVSLVRAFGCGADDYIEKSRPPEEFLARVNAAVRRAQARSAAAKGAAIVRLGAITVNLSTLHITRGLATVAMLTRSEARLLKALAASRGDCVSTECLFDAMHGEGFSGDLMQVRGFVARLRAKLAEAGDLIQNARGVGYRLV